MGIKYSCPICGYMPITETYSLDRGHGHGYPGCYEYIIKCSNTDCPLNKAKISIDDIYRSKDDAIDYISSEWDKQYINITNLINNRNKG